MYEEIEKPIRPVRDVSKQMEGRGKKKRSMPFQDEFDVPPYLTGFPIGGHGPKYLGKGREKYSCKVLRHECRPVSQFHWGEWRARSDCSSTCSHGIQWEERDCLNGTEEAVYNDYCDGGDDAAERYVECNLHLCMDLGDWEEEKGAECYEEDGICVSDYVRECIYETPEEPDVPDECLEEARPCENNDCISSEYVLASDWTECNCSCSPGWQYRVFMCVFKISGEPSDDCDYGTYKLEERECNEDLCHQYTDWEAAEDCSVTCGNGTQRWERLCQLSGGGDIPADCLARVIPCVEEDCPNCDYGMWTEWTDCSQTCEQGTRTRDGTCIDVETMENCEDCPHGAMYTETGNCNADVCFEYSEETPSECSETCGDGTITLTRTCESSGLSSIPEACTSRTEPCNEGACVILGDWLDWSPCSESCKLGEQTRERECIFEISGEPAMGCEQTPEMQYCNVELCAAYTGWITGACTFGLGGCQTYGATETRTCMDDGTVPDGCDTNTTECSGSDAARVYDIILIYDGSTSMDPCTTVDVTVPWNDPSLADDTTYPNFFQQKQFLEEFYCAYNEISSGNTHLGIIANRGPCTPADNYVFPIGGADPFTAIAELDFYCSTGDITSNMFCPLVQTFFTDDGRPGAEDVEIMILPATFVPVAVTVPGAIMGTASFGYFFISGSATYTDPAEFDDLIQFVCFDVTATTSSPCAARLLGGIYDDVSTILINLDAAIAMFPPPP